MVALLEMKIILHLGTKSFTSQNVVINRYNENSHKPYACIWDIEFSITSIKVVKLQKHCLKLRQIKTNI